MKVPHPLALLTGCVVAAAAATYVLPAGRYERRENEATGRQVVVSDTYRQVARAPVGPFQAMVAIPRGLADAADVIFLVFLVGGAFTVVDRTLVLRRSTAWLARRLERRETLVIPVVAMFFAAGGALENMFEEIIALVPVLLLLAGRLGFQPVVAVAMSAGAAAVGSAFSPINPFQAGIAQKLAELPLLSGSAFRIGVMVAALGIWVLWTMRYADRTRGTPADMNGAGAAETGPRDPLILLLVLGAFAALVVGVMRLDWGFEELAALFFVMGVLAGFLGGLGVRGTAEALVEGFSSMAFAAMLIGFARAIFLVLEQGRVVDTVVHGLVSPLEGLPVFFSAIGMMIVHVLVHVPVPSVSGQAVLTMPVLVPLSDVIGLERQVTVLAYQYGAGLCDLLTPTNGALMAVLAAAGVSYDRWLVFVLLRLLALFALGAIAIGVAIWAGLK